SVFGGPDNRAASSSMPGRDAGYAVDDNTSTWWSPDPNDLRPTLTLNLSAQEGQDRTQIFQVDGLRILFGGGSNRGFSGSSVATPVYKYKLDVSIDGQTWTNVVDQSANKVSRNTVFDEIVPTECRYVRLTMLDWPKSSPLSILDMTVFGRPTSYFPNVNPIAPVLDMSNRD
ncbi:MAG: discoidin domain-containing protein, partial [Bacteroidales bacterium]|nr:discoidin domain-containing protein [Bacteroidales bacterium]